MFGQKESRNERKTLKVCVFGWKESEEKKRKVDIENNLS